MTLWSRLALTLLAAALLAPAPRAEEDFDPAALPAWQRYLWEDHALLMRRGEEARLFATADAGAAEVWLQRFWLDRDPTPTTETNERREEHEKRLETARALYPASGPMGLDRRGQDYVLFGPADEVAVIEEWFDDTGHHPERLVWIWLEPAMRATYSDWNLDGEWDIAWDELPSSRPDVRRRVEGAYLQDGMAEDTRLLEELRSGDPLAYQDLLRQLAEGDFVNALEVQSQKVIADLMGSKFRRMEAAYHENRRERLDTYVHDFRVEPLWAVFAVDCYQGASERTRVELSHQVRARDLRFDWDHERQNFATTLVRRVVYRDESGLVAASHEDELAIRAESVEDTRSALLLPGLSTDELRPGRYELALRLEDRGSGRLQIFTTDVTVPGFPADSLQLSDIGFASVLAPGNEPAVFRKGEWIVSPHPLRMFGGDGAVRFYFEVYGLSTDEGGLNDYTVTYRIRPRDPIVRSSWLWTREEVIDAQVGSTFADRHGGRMSRHPLSIAAADFAEDSYVLEVEVHDRLSDRRAQRRAQFSVVPPGSAR